MRRALPLAALALVALAGCASTRDQAEKLTADGDRAFAARGLSVGASNRDVKVLERAVVSDPNGTAAVVVLRNGGPRPLADVPIAIAVRGPRGRAVWRNDAPGLEEGLTHAALLAPGQTVTWVNDQILAPGRPSGVGARVGAGEPAPAGAERLQIEIAGARLEGDPVSGVTAAARAVNRSDVTQHDLVISSVARRGGRVVAAGRAIVPVLEPGDGERFHVFYIGDPRGAQLSFDVQPSTLRGTR